MVKSKTGIIKRSLAGAGPPTPSIQETSSGRHSEGQAPAARGWLLSGASAQQPAEALLDFEKGG